MLGPERLFVYQASLQFLESIRFNRNEHDYDYEHE